MTKPLFLPFPELWTMARMLEKTEALLVLALLCGAMMTTSGCTGKAAGFVLAESACERLSGFDRDHCYQYLARVEKDTELCEKIENRGPWSKCHIYLGDCLDLPMRATGDGAYTRYDCGQYLAVERQSVDLCEYTFKEGYRGGPNDLNPKGTSLEICIEAVTKNCGQIGENVCWDKETNKKYCMYGMIDMGKCIAKT